MRWVPACSLTILVFLPAEGARSAKIDFAKQIQPIFEKSCYSCHGPKQQMAGLRLDTRSSAFAASIVPHNAAASPLYKRVAGAGGLAQMPLGGKLSPAEIATLRSWID